MKLSFSRHSFVYAAVFILSLFFISCQKKTNKPGQFSFDDFKTQSLPGQPMKLENLHQAVYLTIIPERNLLLIIELQDSCYIKAYDLKTFRFIKGFIKQGSKVNEQLDCSKLQYDKAAKYLYAIDRLKGKIFKYTIDDIIDPKKEVFQKAEITLNNNGLSKPLLLANGNFVDYSIVFKQQPTVFSFYDANGAPLFKRGRFPQIKQDYTSAEVRTAFEGEFLNSKDGQHIALCYYNADYIDIYDSTGNLQHRVHGPELFEPAVTTKAKFWQKMIVNDEGSHFAYGTPKMKGDSLLVLYQGKGWPEGAYHMKKLMLFNQQLQPKVLYNLAQPVFMYDIDWKTKTLYALTDLVKGSNLIVIKLP